MVEPDIFYISKGRSGILTQKNLRGALDLVIEVLSESTARIDRSLKLKLYGEFDVTEDRIIHPNGSSAEIYPRGEEGFILAAKLSSSDALTSPLLPGFSVALGHLT